MKHSHDGKLLVKLNNGEGLRVQLLNTSKGLRNATGNVLEQLVWLQRDSEQLVVQAKAHARHLLAVNATQLVLHCNGVVLNALNVGVLQLRKVDKDVASSLLVCRAEVLSSGIVVEADADVEHLLIHGEWDGGPVLIGPGVEQLKCWCGVLLNDDTPGRELAQAHGL
jgi:hypothetical protein